ncbi:hypothetical protein EON67_00625 [archaeon]|nr:MAG: hypothetical protein EON67_00625 [archaeon]
MQGVEDEVQAEVVSIISNVSYHAQLEKKAAGGASDGAAEGSCADGGDRRLHLLTSIVQDADRLEAIGAIGIARCLMYGGAKHRALYGAADLDAAARTTLLSRQLSAEEYTAASVTSVGHFYAKLLRLKALMRTASGRTVAEERHGFMLSFLNQLFDEVEGRR